MSQQNELNIPPLDQVHVNNQPSFIPSVPSYDHYQTLETPRQNQNNYNPNYNPQVNGNQPVVYQPNVVPQVYQVVQPNPPPTVVITTSSEVSKPRLVMQGISTFTVLIGSFCFIGFGIFFIVMISMGYTNSVTLFAFNNQRTANGTSSTGFQLASKEVDAFNILNIVTFSLMIVLGLFGFVM